MYGQRPWSNSGFPPNGPPPPRNGQFGPPGHDYQHYGDRGGYDQGPHGHGQERDWRLNLNQDRRDSYDSERRQRQRSPVGRRRSRSRSPRRQEREWDRGKRPTSPPNHRYSRDEGRDHERDNRDRDHRRPFREDPPSRTVMLRGLPQNCFEAEIRHALDPQIAPFVDIRVPRTPEGGNRGFGFVEFTDVATATTWMDYNQASLCVVDVMVRAHFCEDREVSKKRDSAHFDPRPPRPPPSTASDWECSRCGCNNFRHRNTCFRCEASRNEAEVVVIPNADEQVGLAPCNTLLFRNLDQADEVKITQALCQVLPTAAIKQAKVMRDPRTQASLAFGFVQFKTINDATEMYNCLMRANTPLTIDGKQVSISFAKTPLSDLTNPPAVPQGSAGGGARSHDGYGQGNDVNSAAAVAQLALKQMQKNQQSANVIQGHMHGQVNMTGYQYDPTSGYYYDPNSQLYYDPKTGYYYNSQTQQYLAWYQQTMSYTVVPPAVPPPTASTVPTAASVAVPESAASQKTAEEVKVETEKERQAKKIVQDMEKWAKSQNTRTVQKKAVAAPPPIEVKIGAVASVFKEDDEEESTPTEVPKLTYKTISIPSVSARQPSVENVPDNTRSEGSRDSRSLSRDRSHSPAGLSTPFDQALVALLIAEDKLVDWERMACLLCKRQLQTKELLHKHLEMSDLHLRNLEAHRRQTMTEEQIEALEAREREMKYRDRAKERRQKYGETESVPPFNSFSKAMKRSAAEASSSEHTHEEGAALGEGNVGAKLMKAMGWSEGKGLGKSKQGITAPVEAKGHSGTAGLGSTETAADILPSDSYADKVRKTMRQRFQQMN